MSDLLSDIGGVIGSVAGPLVSGGLSLIGGIQQNQGQQQSIQQQEDFQQKMSSSAYQRAVADMKAADLNPALMFSGGGPESTPSGSSATPANVMAGVSSSALDAMRLKNESDMNRAQITGILAKAANDTQDLPVHRFEGDVSTLADAFMPVLKKLIGGIASRANDTTPSSQHISDAIKNSPKNPFDALGWANVENIFASGGK